MKEHIQTESLAAPNRMTRKVTPFNIDLKCQEYKEKK